MKYLFLLFCLFFSVFSAAETLDLSAVKKIPVQDGGRIKPLDSFARETLQLIHGKKSFNGESAVQVILSWLSDPMSWQEKNFIEINRAEIKKLFAVSEARRYFSPSELLDSSNLSVIFQDLDARRSSGQKLTAFYQDLELLEHKLYLYREISSGNAPRLVPIEGAEQWLPIADAGDEVKAEFALLLKAIFDNSNPSEKQRVIESFIAKVHAIDGQQPVWRDRLETEIFYNDFHPFKWAWIFYLLALIVVVMGVFSQRKIIFSLSWLLVIIGFLFHTFGFALRVYLTERPPVSNMYETVVWVSWGVIFFAALSVWLLKKRFPLGVGCGVSILCLIVADSAPAILDSTLQPLVPVLRSSLWLTFHVLTITISYSAFFLSLAFADWGLYQYLRGEKVDSSTLTDIAYVIYRTLQVGVVLLAVGIILGGVWADYSWGRFWGWDPKETWSLIALLGYLALIHSRLIGWIKNLGMLVGSILAFNLVIMAWYGVNYILGAGLHSYGFGAGGVEWVLGFVVLHLVLIGAAAIYQKRRVF